MFYKTLAMACLTMGLVSCDNSKNLKRPDAVPTKATYSTESLSGTSEITKTDDALGVPTEKTVTFTICLEDKINSARIAGRDFKVLDSQKILANVRTDASGCFSWSESYKYNHQIDIKAFNLIRTIESSRKNGGTIDVYFALNLWASDDEELVSELAEKPKEVDTVSSTQELKLKLNEEANRPLWVEYINLKHGTPHEVHKQNDHIYFELRFQPQLLTFHADNKMNFTKLDKGEFKVELFMIYKFRYQNKAHKIVINNVTESILTPKFESDELFQRFLMPFIVLPSQGHMTLGMRVTATERSDIRPFEGHFDLGNINDWNTFSKIRTADDVLIREEQHRSEPLKKEPFNLEMFLNEENNTMSRLQEYLDGATNQSKIPYHLAPQGWVDQWPHHESGLLE